jgi:Domain of unknown function (DUF4157)
LRPRSARVPEEDSDAAGRLAAAGRTDAMGVEHLLGLQRAAGNTSVSRLLEDEERSPVHDVVGTAGEPLEAAVRSDMEARLGADFSDVRVHTDRAAQASADAVQARAYTVGNHLVFQRDAYQPGSDDGVRTIAHELTHVIQQRSGPVEGTPSGGGIQVSDPADRDELAAAATAEHVMSDAAGPVASGDAQGAAAAPVQRQLPEEDTDEETLQALRVQRQLPEEETEEEPTS